MLLFNNKLELLNTIMILIIIIVLLFCYVGNYFKSIENFNTYGYVACPPQFTKIGDTNNMYYDYNDGNVGIGLDDPSSKLHVKGDTKLDGALVVNGPTQSQFTGGILLKNGWCAIKGNGGIYWTDWEGGWNMSDKYWIRSYGNKHVYMDNYVGIGGYLGVGTSEPKYRLDVKGDTKIDGALVVNGTTQSQFTGGILLNNGWYAVKGSGGIYWEDYGGGWNMLNSTWITSYGTKHVYMDRNVAVGGYLGVGTTNPQYRLDVIGHNEAKTGIIRLRYFNYEWDNQHYAEAQFADTIARFNGSIWVTNWIGSSSDERIKKDIRDLDDNEMLNKLMLIKPKKYKYKDKLKSDTEVYGFIAQQVKEVMGNAGVELKSEYIYDINDTGTINSNIITCKYNLEVSSNYRIHTFDGNEKNIVIEKKLGYNQYEISGYTSNKNQQIHIQGKRVDDFHVLNKNAIFTMNVGATQELYKIIMNLQKQNQLLLNKVQNLEKRLY